VWYEHFSGNRYWRNIRGRGVALAHMRQNAKIHKIDMIDFVKPVLTEDLHIVHKEEFSVTCYKCDTYI
jgi:hypothetical protein